MTQLANPQHIVLAAGQKLETTKIPVSVLSGTITIRLARPTTAKPLNWLASAKLKTVLVIVVDGVERRIEGSVSGGVRLDRFGVEIPEYVLIYRPGLAANGTLLPPYQNSNFEAYASIEAIGGPVETQLVNVEVT
jgi:hypothetical protein